MVNSLLILGLGLVLGIWVSGLSIGQAGIGGRNTFLDHWLHCPWRLLFIFEIEIQ